MQKHLDLVSETVEGAALALEGVDNIHSGDSLALGMISVGDRVADNRLKEDTEDGAGLFVDQVADTLNTTTASQAADSGLGDTLDVIAQNLAMALGTSLS